MRSYEIERKTNETDIKLMINIDGTGNSKIDTLCPFLDHMLTLFSKHSGFDLEIKCIGDIAVDYHHTVEDIAICLGEAFNKALGDKKGIARYGDMLLPMDEALILTAVDLSGRSYLGYSLDIPSQRVGTFDTELVEEFFVAFCSNAKLNLHIRQISGTNSHHIIEGAFKSVARSLRKAIAIDEQFKNEIPSTKGVL